MDVERRLSRFPGRRPRWRALLVGVAASVVACGGGGAEPATPDDTSVRALPRERAIATLLDPDAAVALEVVRPDVLVAGLETLADAVPGMLLESVLGDCARSFGVRVAPLRGLLAAATEVGFYFSEVQGATKHALVLRVRGEEDVSAIVRDMSINSARSTALFEVRGEGEDRLVAYSASQHLLVLGTARAITELEGRVRAGGAPHRELSQAKLLLGGAPGVAIASSLAGPVRHAPDLAPALGSSVARAALRFEGGSLRTTVELRDVRLPGLARCLEFTMTSPFYYQYDYRTAQPFKGPARGGPDPGPGGFEVSAEGDLDGDGKTSLFTRVGRFDAKKRVITLSDPFSSDEQE